MDTTFIKTALTDQLAVRKWQCVDRDQPQRRADREVQAVDVSYGIEDRLEDEPGELFGRGSLVSGRGSRPSGRGARKV